MKLIHGIVAYFAEYHLYMDRQRDPFKQYSVETHASESDQLSFC